MHLIILWLCTWVLALTPAQPGVATPPDFPVRVTNDALDAIPVTLQPGANIGVDGDVVVDGTVHVEPGVDPLVTMGAGAPFVLAISGSKTCGLDEGGEIRDCGGAVRTEQHEVPEGKLLVLDAVTVGFRCFNCSVVPRRDAVLFVTQSQFIPYRLGAFDGIFTHSGLASEAGLGIHLSEGMKVDAECVAPNDLKAERRECTLSIAGRLFDLP